jgi:hypothetical protein
MAERLFSSKRIWWGLLWFVLIGQFNYWLGWFVGHTTGICK